MIRALKFWVTVLALLFAARASAGEVWRELEPGLDLGRFDSRSQKADAEGDLTVLRVDPHRFALRILTTGKAADAPGRNLARWCEDFGLLAAINAGMYQADHRTHVGYCKVEGELANGFANDYLSLAAFGPTDPDDPPFRIFELDETPLNQVVDRYQTVVQNLRLIKRHRENRWQPAVEQWRESALAEDGEGRALLIFCRTAWSMHQFNEILLALPLAIVAAQHLEGRSPARFWVNHAAYDAGPEAPAPGPVLPNVLGIMRRSPEGPPAGADLNE